MRQESIYCPPPCGCWRQSINAGLLRSRLMAQEKLAVKAPETAAET